MFTRKLVVEAPGMEYLLRLWQKDSRLDAILANQEEIKKGIKEFMAGLVELKAAVARNTDAVKSALALIRGISAKLKDAIEAAKTDPAALQALVTELDNSDTELAAAVTENTPAAPATPPVEPAPATP